MYKSTRKRGGHGWKMQFSYLVRVSRPIANYGKRRRTDRPTEMLLRMMMMRMLVWRWCWREFLCNGRRNYRRENFVICRAHDGASSIIKSLICVLIITIIFVLWRVFLNRLLLVDLKWKSSVDDVCWTNGVIGGNYRLLFLMMARFSFSFSLGLGRLGRRCCCCIGR